MATAVAHAACDLRPVHACTTAPGIETAGVRKSELVLKRAPPPAFREPGSVRVIVPAGARRPAGVRAACARRPDSRVLARRYAAPPRGSKRSMPTPNERIAEVEVLFRAGNERMMEWTQTGTPAPRAKQLFFFCKWGVVAARPRSG